MLCTLPLGSSVTVTLFRLRGGTPPTPVVLQTWPLYSTLTTSWSPVSTTLVLQALVTRIPGSLSTVGQAAVVASVIDCRPPSLEAALTLMPLVGPLPAESKLPV
ncbi:hypothetical protein D3C80_1284250 [compost metagenome]